MCLRKRLLLLPLLMILLLGVNACIPLSVEGEAVTPVSSLDLQPSATAPPTITAVPTEKATVTATVVPPATATSAPTPTAGGDARPILVDDVQILTGWASPIPALVEVSGAWPGPCAQLAEIGQPVIDDFHIEISLLATITVNTLVIQTGVESPTPVHAQVIGELPSLCSQLATVKQDVQPFHFDVTLLAHPGRADCPPDAMGLGFRLDVPLNIAELPQGTHTVNVNGVETTFETPLTADPSAINSNPSDGAEGSLSCSQNRM